MSRSRKSRQIWLSGNHTSQDFDNVVAFEHRPSSQHFVQDTAEGKNIGALVDRATFRLFRRHVRRGSEDHAGLRCCEAESWRVGKVRLPGLGFEGFSQSEVEYLHPPVWCDLHIGRFQVSMNDSFFV